MRLPTGTASSVVPTIKLAAPSLFALTTQISLTLASFLMMLS